MGIARLRDVPVERALDAQHRPSPKTGEIVFALAPGALLSGCGANPSGVAPLWPPDRPRNPEAAVPAVGRSGARCTNGWIRWLGRASPGKSLRDPYPHR